MLNIPDAPWIRDPEPYIDEYYGGPVYLDDEEEEDERASDEDEEIPGEA